MKTDNFEELVHHLHMIPFLVDTLINKYTAGKAGEDVYNDVELEEELTVLSDSLSSKRLKEFEKELLYNLQDFNIEPKILANYYLSNILEKKINLIYNYIPCNDEEVALIYLYSNDIAEQISALRYILKLKNKKDLFPKIFHAQSIIYYSESVYNDIVKFIYDNFLVMGYDLKTEFISNNIFFYSYDEDWNYKNNLLLLKSPICAASKFTLPKDLDTERANKYYNKAIKEELITVEQEYLQRNEKYLTKALLAYLTERIHCNDISTPYPETALNRLFKETRLGKARSQYSDNKNTDGKPKGYEIIDELFED